MDIGEFLVMATELEDLAAKLYESLAAVSTNPDLAKELQTLSNQEINHANILKMGLNYYKEMPDVFAGIAMPEEDVWMGIEEAKRFQARIVSGFDILEGLKTMLVFEGHFEKIHIGTSMKITDPSLRKLFMDLTNGDQSHIVVLKKLIELYGEGN